MSKFLVKMPVATICCQETGDKKTGEICIEGEIYPVIHIKSSMRLSMSEDTLKRASHSFVKGPQK
jgi:hypothetical protein